MKLLDLVPRLPTRYELLLWLTGDLGEVEKRLLGIAPEKFNIAAGGCSVHLGDDDPPCPLAEYQRRRYALKSVEADGWTLLAGQGHGITLAWDIEDNPVLLGLARTLAILTDAGIRDVSRGEMIEILKGWENPHDLADRINHARRFAA